MKSRFISVEGIDGSGKSTMVKYIGEWLNKNHIPNIVVESYPRDQDSMFLRDLWIQKKVPATAVFSIILELRKRVLFGQILPALGQGMVVISDRWHDTTYVYQGAGDYIPKETIDAIYKSDFYDPVQNYIRQLPHWLDTQHHLDKYRTIYLDVSIETSDRRVLFRPGQELDAFEKQGSHWKQRLIEGYRNRFGHRHPEKSGDLHVVDANLSIENVKSNIDRLLEEMFPQF